MELDCCRATLGRFDPADDSEAQEHIWWTREQLPVDAAPLGIVVVKSLEFDSSAAT